MLLSNGSLCFKPVLEMHLSWKYEVLSFKGRGNNAKFELTELTELIFLCFLQMFCVNKTCSINTFQNLSVLSKIYRIICEPHIYEIQSKI